MEDYRSIVVASGKKQVTVAENPTSYPMIGKGKQGAVFKLSADRCIKIFAEEQRCLNETKVLLASQEARIVPRVFETGPKYIVMEFLDGPSLDQLLEEKGVLPEWITTKILLLLKEMKHLGFTRLDAKLRHIYVTKEQELIVIDHANSFLKIDTKPTELLKDLKELCLLSSFLEQVKQLDPEMYSGWKDHSVKKKKSNHGKRSEKGGGI